MDGTPIAAIDSSPHAAVSSALVFVRDPDSEGVIRQCLSDIKVAAVEIKTGNVDDAINELRSKASPRLLIVDIHGANDPVARMHELANVCDPTTGVLVIGDQNDIRLYRDLKASGVVEYFYKPLVRTLVMNTMNSIITGSKAAAATNTGKLIFVVSVRGGAGATTIAVATAWYLAEAQKRRVSLLDLDLQFGDAALQLDAQPSHALQEALEHPDRVDELFLDRAMAHAGERLGVMAALEPLNETLVPSEAAVLSLMERLLRRDRYVFVDMPITTAPSMMRVMALPSTILLVSRASLVCARDVVRLREKIGVNSAERVILHILNKSGSNDGLSVEEFTTAVGAKPDIVIPYGRDIAAASRLGVKGLHKCAALQRGLGPLYRQLSGEKPAASSNSFLQQLFG